MDIPPLSIGKRYNDLLPDLKPKEAIYIVIPGDPVPKGRARARIVTTKSGNQFISFYTPKETEVYEETIRWMAKGAMKGNQPLDCACEVTVEVFIAPPASWSGKKTQSALNGAIKPLSKPDCDNFIKCLDALNGIVFVDDSRIWKVTGEKHYSATPRMEITVNY